MDDPSSNLGVLIVEVSRLMRRSFEKRCHAGHLTQAQARTLVYLARNEGLRQVELAELLEMQPITLARQIDHLEQLGIIERRADPTDRRAYRLYLMDAATGYLKTYLEQGKALREEAVRGLDSEQVATLMAALQVMRANLSAQSGSVTATAPLNGEASS